MKVLERDIFAASIPVVDDQQANILLLEQLLAETGYTEVSTTTDPAQVCALHRQHQYDLILLDLQMPGMAGFQEFGRASCRERVCQYVSISVVAVSLNKK